jgi:hypothetical protein
MGYIDDELNKIKELIKSASEPATKLASAKRDLYNKYELELLKLADQLETIASEPDDITIEDLRNFIKGRV